MARFGITLCLATVLALIEIGSCLQCYQCNSQSDPTCNDPFSSSKSLVDCSTQDSVNYNRLYLKDLLPRELIDSVVGAPRYCHKIVMENGATIRTCLDANPTDLGQSCSLITRMPVQPDPSRHVKTCSVCNKDRCNGASSVAFSLPLALAALLASYLYSKQ
ncbi:uncharacterized protein LOC116771290 [Danaus plexippus]|uniref:uncharacterized protein LOC116771290 n=1 Tax=Danaus plexippus TaxID=13037 RepID=UPI000C86EA31|nr:uncharacterized protein LOC116771290 [Danaus plexippus]